MEDCLVADRIEKKVSRWDTRNERFYIYKFLNKENEVLYVGKTQNIDTRIKFHMDGNGHLTEDCYKKIDQIEFSCFLNKIEMDIYELHYITRIY